MYDPQKRDKDYNFQQILQTVKHGVTSLTPATHFQIETFVKKKKKVKRKKNSPRQKTLILCYDTQLALKQEEIYSKREKIFLIFFISFLFLKIVIVLLYYC